MAKGGNVIDLVCELTNSTVKEALAILDRSGANSHVGYTRFKPNSQKTFNKTESTQKSTVQTSLLDENRGLAGEKEKGGLELLQVADIQKPYLLAYLQSRKIDLDIASVYLKQIHFKPPHTVKSYVALGFPSGDGFEVRNKGFKGFVGIHKAVSTINLENGNSLSILRALWIFSPFCLFIK